MRNSERIVRWKQYDFVAENIKKKSNIVILCHEHPDGDTIGSAFALGLALIQLGKNVKIICEDDFPQKYDHVSKLLSNSTFKDPDYTIAVDVASVELLGENIKDKYIEKINLCIDHHETHINFAECDIVFSDSGSNCENIYDFLHLLNVEITKLMADALYTGIVTDTGCFQQINTYPDTHRVAAELIELGADYKYINRKIFGTKTMKQLQVESFVTNNVQFYFNERCALVIFVAETIRKYDYSDEDISSVNSFVRSIEGVNISIVVKEKEDNNFKVSIRTDGSIDACKICSAFGGGGHKGAAGCSVRGDIKKVKEDILAEVKKYV